MAVVAAAGSGFGLMGEASTATGSETPGRETQFGRWLNRHAPTARAAKSPASGHGALGERLASTASRGRCVGRH
jgi:hypothetical protein